MNQQGIFKKWLWAGVMGILTILLCLIVSDDLLGLNSHPARSLIRTGWIPVTPEPGQMKVGTLIHNSIMPTNLI